MRAHKDPVAMKYSFLEVLTSTNHSHAPNHTPIPSPTSKAVQRRVSQLREHCLEPGRYHKHLSRWLSVFKRAAAIHLVDGEQLQQEPATTLDHVQKFLAVPIMDYHKTLR